MVLTEKEQKIIDKVGKIKLARATIKLYNKLCVPCRKKVLDNPKRKVEEFCVDCQSQIKQRLGGFV